MSELHKKLSCVYDRFESEIENQIRNGILKAGDCVISENAAAAKYGISRRSARTALEHLVEKGLLFRKPGKGTFVASLRSGSYSELAAHSIALILPALSDIFLLMICEGIQYGVNLYNCSMVIKTANGDAEQENRNIRYAVQQQEDGVIIFPNSGRVNVAPILKLKEAKIPFVLIDRKFQDIETDFVGSDNFAGGKMATEYLIRSGCRKIAHLYGTNGSANDDRLAGYRRALADHNIPCDEKLIRRVSDLGEIQESVRFEPDTISGYRNMKKLLEEKIVPDGVFAGNDYQALGAIRAIREAGLKVPDDISVIGFDELKFNPYLETPLTTVRQNQHEIGRHAVEILLSRINQPEEHFSPREVIVPVELVIGKTTRKLP